MIVIITGTPGVGKTTTAAALAKRVPDSVVCNVNQIITERKLYSSRDRYGTKVVKMRGLQLEIERMIRKNAGKNIIFDGHILCELRIRGATVIVLREHIRTIKKRLLKRGYPVGKIRENLVCEATDYCGAKSQANYRKVYELMSGPTVVDKILQLLHRKVPPKMQQIDLLEELVPVIKKEKGFALSIRS
ncbi:MAG: AAA family ATPase [Candidatus Micrarchaeota archaeon]|nr:AAA family ATPase [Candidatus Micrarchaeota archaeon]MDE1804803.1 AAA family ATPase [Candidatus Micrarchaeota archaeon]